MSLYSLSQTSLHGRQVGSTLAFVLIKHFALTLAPQAARDVIASVSSALGRSGEGARGSPLPVASTGGAPPDGAAPVILTQPDIRRFVRKLLESEFPDVSVAVEASGLVAFDAEKTSTVTPGSGAPELTRLTVPAIALDPPAAGVWLASATWRARSRLAFD